MISVAPERGQTPWRGVIPQREPIERERQRDDADRQIGQRHVEQYDIGRRLHMPEKMRLKKFF